MDTLVKSPPKGRKVDSYVELVTRALAESESEKLRSPRRRRNAIPRLAVIVSGLVLFAGGMLFIAWTARRVDRQMREEILLQAQMVAQAVDVVNVAALWGTSADLHSPAYQRLKQQLSLIRSANPKCRFIYLMGQRPDGKLFFLVDSEAPESIDYSPPGETYEEATEDDYRVFETGMGNASGGPYKDRWGVWISAMVPVFNPDTREILAVLGMDFSAASWKSDVAARATPPASPALLAFIIGLLILLFPFRVARG